MGLEVLLSTVVLPALLPLFTKAAGEATSKWLGSPGPRTFEETLKFMAADTQRLESLAKLDQLLGTPSQWVVDLRASSRYIVVFLILLIGGAVALVQGQAALSDPSGPTLLGSLLQSAVFFLLGDRITVAASKKVGK